MASSKELLSVWLDEKLRVGQVPRLSDMYGMAQRDGLKLTRKEIRKQLDQNPVYMFNLHQQKKTRGISKVQACYYVLAGVPSCRHRIL